MAIGRNGRGSGFVIAPGLVLTNAHNLRDATTAVRFEDGRTVQGSVVGSDVDGDLVVLAVDTDAATPLAWSDRQLASGDVVVTVNRANYNTGTVSSNRHRAAGSFISQLLRTSAWAQGSELLLRGRPQGVRRNPWNTAVQDHRPVGLQPGQHRARAQALST